VTRNRKEQIYPQKNT